MALNELPVGEAMLVIPEGELSQLINDAEKFEKLFWELLTIAIGVCAAGSNEDIEQTRARTAKIADWICNHYIDLRSTMPYEIKQLYLREIAFRFNEPR